MNPELLLRRFDRVSEAPDAITRMRQFVLEIAVRGKLVEQDQKDEPASELLKRIEAEKARLAGAGEIRRQKAFSPVDPAEVPFDLPTSWEWVRVRQVSNDRGQTIPSKDFTYIDVGAIDKTAGRLASPAVVSAEDAPSRARKLVYTGDVLYSCVRPYLLNVAVIENDILPSPIASTAFAVLNGLGFVLPKYMWAVLRSPFMVECVESKMRGQAYPAINDADFAQLPFPLPPLAEQHRIVDSIDELMALCDRLEVAQIERERRRNRVVAASLNRLSQPTVDMPAFREHARFHLQHLARLVTQQQHVTELRETILNLAVSGRLVPQEEGEEPARELLRRLRTGNERQANRGGIAKKTTMRIEPGRPAFSLPPNWEAASLDHICELVTSGSRGWAEFYSEVGAKFVRAQNIRFGRLRLDELACVNPPNSTEGSRTRLLRGDLLIVITGAGVTNPAMLDQELGEAYISQHVALVRPMTTELSRWLLTCLMAPVGGRADLVDRAYGAGKPGLNLDNIRSLVVPIPPLAEQRRIVAKVDELMAICDRLEASLGGAQTESGRLLEAVLHDALASSPSDDDGAGSKKHVDVGSEDAVRNSGMARRA